jgi:hypothetical protein
MSLKFPFQFFNLNLLWHLGDKANDLVTVHFREGRPPWDLPQPCGLLLNFWNLGGDCFAEGSDLKLNFRFAITPSSKRHFELVDVVLKLFELLIGFGRHVVPFNVKNFPGYLC